MTEPQRNRIPAPSGERRPLKVNVFEAAKAACSQLLPLFPYLGPDAIVPAVGVGLHEEGSGPAGYFFHENSVDEVGMCLGAGGGEGARSGMVFSTTRTHPVGQSKDDPEPAIGSHAVITVTQRNGSEEQRESFILRCSNCKHGLLRHRYSFVPTVPSGGELEEFMTLVECANGAEEFNASIELRTCSKCQHVNDPFPLDAWGWRKYRTNTKAAEQSRHALLSASEDIGGPTAWG